MLKSGECEFDRFFGCFFWKRLDSISSLPIIFNENHKTDWLKCGIWLHKNVQEQLAWSKQTQFTRGLFSLITNALFTYNFIKVCSYTLRGNLNSWYSLQVARVFNRDDKTIQRLDRKLNVTGSVDDLPRKPKRDDSSTGPLHSCNSPSGKESHSKRYSKSHFRNAWKALKWPNCAKQAEWERIACETTICRLGVVSQTQTASLSLSKTSSEAYPCRLRSSSLYRWVQVQFAAIKGGNLVVAQ